ncbi:transcription elongation factor [Polychaeton citri CBS 116435]|uniref:Transcription elongation factor n=1 Tax=Polychaeton citri CBS 116435 TaxID=1314669 RepID=A0A9P4QEM2_9PEZI|nr:transcription elongation factor [Polychaeton citri CBS 116435]
MASSSVTPKQLADTAKQLQKAVESGDAASSLLNLIAPIQKWTATEDLLRQTKIGVAVNKLRQNKDAKVSQQASQLINKWKADVKSKERSKTSSPAPGAGKAGNGIANGRASGTNSPAPAATPTPAPPASKSGKFKGDPSKRNSAADGVKTEVTGNKVRDACIKMTYDGIAFMSEEAPDDVLSVARSVELAAYNKYQPETSAEYKQKLRSLFQNLKMKNNAWLRKAVFEGTIEPTRFVTMSSDELKSQAKRESDAALERENMMKAMTAQEEKSVSETMQCGKCKKYRVSYSQAQTRSADEPLTTFCECIVCGHRWKFS